MGICYNEDKARGFTGKPIPYADQPASNYWMTHMENSLYLTFLAQKSDDFRERQQALKELGIAETKMTFWKRHPNWDLTWVTAKTAIARKKWAA